MYKAYGIAPCLMEGEGKGGREGQNLELKTLKNVKNF